MKLTENNCPLLKYLRWEKSLFEHPDFKDTVIPLNSEFGKKIIAQIRNNGDFGKQGLKVSRIIDTGRLGKHGFLRPYTTEYSREIQKRIKRSGGKMSDYADVFVDFDVVDEEMYDNSDKQDGGHDNWTDFSDSLVDLNKQWGERSVAFRNNIDVVSANFWTAMVNSAAAFLKESILSILNGQTLQGTIIVPTQKGLSFLYDVKINRIFASGDAELNIDCDGTVICLHDYTKTKVLITPEYQFVDQSYLLEGDSKDKVLSDAIFSVALYELFKRYADVEVKLARQCRQHVDNLEVNTFTKDVNYIDCSWFTTIIRTEGFKVRGHFRLQPCGVGRNDHKLIYINEFEKHGYTRRAKVLKNK